MTNRIGQRVISPEAANAVALADINHVYGSTATYLERPANGASLLVLNVEAGSFRVKPGDFHTTLSTTAPSASVTDGSGSLKLSAGDKLVLPAPLGVTVVGASGTDILTYYWL